MKTHFRTFALPVLLALTMTVRAGDPLAHEARALKDMAQLIRQDEALLRWRDIPWYLDAVEGLKTAREEKRPVLLWVTGDDPLGRC